MERVVYILGAGFSRPLGIPTMREFMDVARDMHFAPNSEYSHFANVFEGLSGMNAASRFVKLDRENIEHVLSFLEMEYRSTGEESERISQFRIFIRDVIVKNTPSFDLPVGRRGENADIHTDRIFSAKSFSAAARSSDLRDPYFRFVCSITNVCRTGPRLCPVTAVDRDMGDGFTHYSVLTLNYDQVLESSFNAVRTLLITDRIPNRVRLVTDANCNARFLIHQPQVIHLHGDVSDVNSLVAPTFTKPVDSFIEAKWKTAYELIRDANHIRFIGYSLPDGDQYLQYLISSALGSVKNLKRIDVICLDSSEGEVKKRFDKFFTPGRYWFMNTTTEEYLGALRAVSLRTPGQEEVGSWIDLERQHLDFMRSNS